MANDLHGAIMNIPCNPGERPPTYALAYKLGHRDARHAAAELALTSPVAPEQVVVVPRTTIDGFLDHWMRDVPEEYRPAARARAKADIEQNKTAGPLHTAWDAWQACCAASPEAAPAAMEGAGPAMQLNATQLRSALELAAPDFDTDEDQREVEVVLQRLPARTSTDGEPMEAGLYCWLAEYPEEGCIPLREDEAFPAATPAAPSAVMDERAGFEAWADDQGFVLQRVIRGDDYQDLRTQGPWDAWQARAALAQPAPVQAGAQQAAAECPNCKGTRAPSALDPEWKGRCECSIDLAAPTQAGAGDAKGGA